MNQMKELLFTFFLLAKFWSISIPGHTICLSPIIWSMASRYAKIFSSTGNYSFRPEDQFTFWFANLTSTPWTIFESNCADSDFVEPKTALVQVADKSILLDKWLMIFWISFKQIYSKPIALIFIPAKNDICIMMFAFIRLSNTN